MTSAYWRQWNSDELASMHGVEKEDFRDDDDYDVDYDDYEEEDQDRCPQCLGGGCNYCLMLEY